MTLQDSRRDEKVNITEESRARSQYKGWADDIPFLVEKKSK